MVELTTQNQGSIRLQLLIAEQLPGRMGLRRFELSDDLALLSALSDQVRAASGAQGEAKPSEEELFGQYWARWGK